MFEPMPFERSKHVYRCDAFSELLKDAVRFFHGTPVCAFPHPGAKRFSGMVTQWDALHPRRAWAKKMSGEMPDVKMLNRRVKDYLVGTR